MRSRIEPAVTLVGRIIADPNRSGVVQSTIAGRIGCVDGALPRLGQPVTAGQVLAIVTPAYAAIDATNVAQTGGELDQQIALAQNKVEQFRPLVRSNTLSPERLRTVEIELENLKKRRATLATSQRGAEPLTAPVDGVIAGMRALPGQVVSPQDVLFQIVDPKSLWVEALVFDPTVPQLSAEATATAAGTAPLKLSFIGRSRALQQLSTVIHFRRRRSAGQPQHRQSRDRLCPHARAPVRSGAAEVGCRHGGVRGEHRLGPYRSLSVSSRAP